MSEFFPDHAHAAPTTQQMRTIGQRRRDAEEKLEQHLQEARHKDPAHHSAPVTQSVPLIEVPEVAGQDDGGMGTTGGIDPNPGR